MADLVVIVPSRGRPAAAVELADAFQATCQANTELVFAVDDDDPTRDGYVAAQMAHRWASVAVLRDPTNMVGALNRAAALFANRGTSAFAIGFMGDDHRPRTVGWDKEYLDALREVGTGIVYGDDLYQGDKLPTQCAMTADIVRELGYMCPPTLRHMYVDNFWMDLGSQADCLYYLPDVVIEHMHPVAGKAEWDEGHKRVNAREVYDADALAYDQYGRERFADDLDKVRALVGAR